MKISVSVRGETARIALLAGDVLQEYVLWNFENPDGVGDVHTGRVTAKLPAMAGSFVEIGGATGFLPDSAGAAGLTEGTYLAVQVTRAAQGGKGPRLAAVTAPLLEKPGLMHRGPGPLLELCAKFPKAPVVVDEYALLARLRSALEGRVSYQAQAFDAVLEDEIAGLAEPAAALPHGALMHIAVTPALTAIDIDAGAATGERAGKAASQLALNIAILPEICRQIRLRNLSGAILVDFAGMKSRDRVKLTENFTAALGDDPLQPRLLGFSNFGFAEISRPRIRPPLHEVWP
jgi:Ribonuclease G/E